MACGAAACAGLGFGFGAAFCAGLGLLCLKFGEMFGATCGTKLGAKSCAKIDAAFDVNKHRL